MRLAYSPLTHAWYFISGINVSEAAIVSLWDASGFVGRSFQSRADAVYSAGMCGLKVSSSNVVSVGFGPFLGRVRYGRDGGAGRAHVRPSLRRPPLAS